MSEREPLVALTFDDGEYELVGLDHTPLQEAIVPVVAWDGHLLHWLGTAFAIASAGLFLTARHVFQEFVDDHGERPKPARRVSTSTGKRTKRFIRRSKSPTYPLFGEDYFLSWVSRGIRRPILAFSR